MYMLQESGTRVISVFRCEKRLLNWHVEWRNPRRHDSTYEVKNNNKQKKKNCNQRKKCNVQSDLHNKGPLCTVTRARRNIEYPCIKQDITNYQQLRLLIAYIILTFFVSYVIQPKDPRKECYNFPVTILYSTKLHLRES